MAKVMISLPDELLKKIDERARARNMSRSGLLAEVAAREVQRPTPEQMDEIIERGRERFKNAGPFDAADLVRADRDSHWSSLPS